MCAPIDFKHQEVGFHTHSDNCSVFHFIKMQQNAGYNLTHNVGLRTFFKRAQEIKKKHNLLFIPLQKYPGVH